MYIKINYDYFQLKFKLKAKTFLKLKSQTVIEIESKTFISLLCNIICFFKVPDQTTKVFKITILMVVKNMEVLEAQKLSKGISEAQNGPQKIS